MAKQVWQAGREASSAGHGLHHRTVREQQIRHLQPRTRCSCDLERVPGTLEAPRRDNPTRMISRSEEHSTSRSYKESVAQVMISRTASHLTFREFPSRLVNLSNRSGKLLNLRDCMS